MQNLDLNIRSSKQFQSLLLELGHSMGYEIEVMAENRIYKLINPTNKRNLFLYNADLGLNSSASLLAAKDKSATYALLTHLDVPAIEHIQIETSADHDYITECTRYLNLWDKVVLKDNEGTQGRNVFLIDSQESLVTRLESLKQKGKRICLSKFYEADLETRCVVYNGEVRIAFSKIRTNSWKHNLSQGATPIPIDLMSPDTFLLQRIAVETAEALGMRFCSVDIMETTVGYRVLEVNGTVLMNHYQKYSDIHRQIVVDLYREIFTDILVG